MWTEQLRLIHGAHAEPGQVELVVGHHPWMLGRLAAQQGATRATATLGHAFHDRGDALGDHATHRQVVQEEERLGAGAHHVVRAHGHQVDPDGVEPAGHARDLELGPHAVGGRGQESPVARAEEAGEPSDLIGHLGAAGLRREVGDQRDRLRRCLGVHAGPAVRVAHAVPTFAQALGSRS